MLTAAVALGVAALALLSPLQQDLREQAVRDLVATAVQSRSAFSELNAQQMTARSERLRHVIRSLARSTGARIAVLEANVTGDVVAVKGHVDKPHAEHDRNRHSQRRDRD